jgi:tetratricopeptide (TPR) repeat protein
VEALARAVHYAHQKGIVHRDLKPANILLQEVPGAGSRAGAEEPSPGGFLPRITDFGLAKRVEAGASLTRAGEILGTPNYMAPEQARGQVEEVGPHSDTWALGAILYECLTGRPPFQGPTPTFTLLQVTEVEPVPPRALQPEVPRDLETICLKCLQKEPSKRYESAEALADDLRRFQAGRPIHARPLGPLGRGWRWCRRNPVVAGLTGLTAAVFAGAFVAVTMLWCSAERGFAEAAAQRRRAEENERRANDERDRAEEEKRVAEAVGRFLQIDLLRQADPFAQADALREAGGGFKARENPTIKELLDRAAGRLTAGRIEAKFPRQPRVQGEILRTVGSAYLAVGEYAKAIDHLARARDLLTRTRGPGHPDTVRTLRDLAEAYRGAGRTAEAIELLQKVCIAGVFRFGPLHPLTLASLARLATAYVDARRTTEAVVLREAVRYANVVRFGPHHRNTLASMVNLAGVYRTAGRPPAASIALLEKVRAAHLSRFGPEHPSTLVTLHSLALSYRRAGRTAEAITLLEKVRDAKVARFGLDHPRTLNALHALAVAYRSAGKPEKSVPLFKQALRLRKAKLGPDHADTLRTMAELGVTYRKAGRQAEAAALLEEALARARKLPGPLPAGLGWVERALADTYARGE